MKKILIILCLLCVGCTHEPQTLEELKTAGKESFVKEDYNSAKNYLSKALLIKASDKDALYFIGQTFQKINQHDSAIYYFKRADILHPNERELNKAIYRSAKLTKDYSNAIKAIDVLIKTGDNPEQYYFELADYNLRSENVYVSFLYLRRMWEEGTDDPTIYLNLGNVATQVDSVLFAIKIIKEAISRFGENEQFMIDLAVYTAVINDLPESEAILRKILAKNPISKDIRYALGKILSMYDSKTKKEESLQIFQKLRVEFDNIMSLDSLIIDLIQQLDY